MIGTTDVQVAYEGQTATLPLVIVKGEEPAVLGRNWISQRLEKYSLQHQSWVARVVNQIF